MTCCTESGCKRSQPILIRKAPFSGEWMAITRYKLRDGGLVESQEKHVLSGPTQAEIELAGSVLQDLHSYMVNEYHAEDTEDGNRVYLHVLEKLAELARAKRAALLIETDETAGATS